VEAKVVKIALLSISSSKKYFFVAKVNIKYNIANTPIRFEINFMFFLFDETIVLL
jgi:hypothetical protein